MSSVNRFIEPKDLGLNPPVIIKIITVKETQLIDYIENF